MKVVTLNYLANRSIISNPELFCSKFFILVLRFRTGSQSFISKFITHNSNLCSLVFNDFLFVCKFWYMDDMIMYEVLIMLDVVHLPPLMLELMFNVDSASALLILQVFHWFCRCFVITGLKIWNTTITLSITGSKSRNL